MYKNDLRRNSALIKGNVIAENPTQHSYIHHSIPNPSSVKSNHYFKHSKDRKNMIHPDEKSILFSSSNYSISKASVEQSNGDIVKKSIGMSTTNYKCLLCNIEVTSLKTFNMHLKNHFNNELLLKLKEMRPPYICNHSKCKQERPSNTNDNEIQFKSSMNLLDHMINSHNLVLNMYNQSVQTKICSAITHPNSAITLKNNPLPIKTNSIKDIEKKSSSEDENVFVCRVCRNKNGKVNEYMRNYERMIAPGVFTEETHLRMHLIDIHFKDLIIKYAEKELKIILDQSPIVCPFLQCRKGGISFREERLFHSHFLEQHHKQLNLPKLKEPLSSSETSSLVLINLQRICLDCDFVADASSSAGIHMCKVHPHRFNKVLSKLSMKNTLLPIKKSSLEIPWGKYVSNNIGSTQHSVSKDFIDVKGSKYMADTNNYSYSKTNKRKNEDSNKSVLKCKQMKIGDSALNISVVNDGKFYSTTKSTKANEKDEVSDDSHSQFNNHEPKCTLRPPNKSEMDTFLKDCYSKPICYCCGAEVWDIADNRGVRLNRLCKHLFQQHFFQEIRSSVIDLICQMKTSQRCPQCQEEFQEKELMEHMAVFHRRVLKSYWEYVTFSKTAYSISKSIKKPAKLQLATKLNKLGEESGQTLEIQRIALQKKLGELAIGDVITQPDACFNVSSTLNYCHECWKIHKGITPQVKGTVCQFAGFRKIKKIRKNYQELSEFESAGFLDPFKDPTESDCSLWEVSEDHLHPNVDIDIAKFILEQAGDEFCNMIHDEENVIQEFVQERRKLGKNSNILWKRLQPQVREMCDVCSTSLFNVHWTCTTCGCLICIDCYRTRKKGYQLIYSSAGKTNGNSTSIPHKSRRQLIRNDIDDHFWPFCKNNIRHNPSRYLQCISSRYSKKNRNIPINLPVNT